MLSTLCSSETSSQSSQCGEHLSVYDAHCPYHKLKQPIGLACKLIACVSVPSMLLLCHQPNWPASWGFTPFWHDSQAWVQRMRFSFRLHLRSSCWRSCGPKPPWSGRRRLSCVWSVPCGTTSSSIWRLPGHFDSALCNPLRPCSIWCRSVPDAPPPPPPPQLFIGKIIFKHIKPQNSFFFSQSDSFPRALPLLHTSQGLSNSPNRLPSWRTA